MNNKKYGTYYMESENIKLLSEHEKRTGVKKSTTVNMALKEFFKKNERGVKQ